MENKPMHHFIPKNAGQGLIKGITLPKKELREFVNDCSVDNFFL